MKYRIHYDLGRPVVLVGHSVYHDNLQRDLNRLIATEIHSLEHILSQNDEWMSERQFFHATSNIAWKKHLTDALSVKNVAWISVVNENSEIDESCFLGRGVWINNHNVLMDHCRIGDHAVITNQCLLGHHVDLGEFSHLSPRCHLSWCSIGRYNCLASNCTVLGSDHMVRVTTADRCNFKLNTVLTSNISLAGTYKDKKLVDARDSLVYKFF